MLLKYHFFRATVALYFSELICFHRRVGSRRTGQFFKLSPCRKVLSPASNSLDPVVDLRVSQPAFPQSFSSPHFKILNSWEKLPATHGDSEVAVQEVRVADKGTACPYGSAKPTCLVLCTLGSLSRANTLQSH